MQNQRMVELRDNVPHRYVFDFTEIDHQTLLGMTGLTVNWAGNCYMQPIGMTMYVFTRPVVPVKSMSHIEGEDFGNANSHLKIDSRQN